MDFARVLLNVPPLVEVGRLRLCFFPSTDSEDPVADVGAVRDEVYRSGGLREGDCRRHSLSCPRGLIFARDGSPGVRRVLGWPMDTVAGPGPGAALGVTTSISVDLHRLCVGIVCACCWERLLNALHHLMTPGLNEEAPRDNSAAPQ